MRETALATALAVLTILPCATGSPVEKTDVVVLENGNQILGEIKKLERGTLSFKTDSAGTLSIEWDEVLALTSPDRFRVELKSGIVYYAIFRTPPAERKLSLDDEKGQFVVDLMDVVKIGEIEDKFWDKVDAYVNAGFSYTKSSEVAQQSFSGGVAYKERQWKASLDLNAINTSQPGELTAKKNDLTTKYTRFLKDRHLVIGVLQFEQNSELGLDLRTTVGGAYGKYFVQTNTQLLSAQAGLAVNSEEPSGVGEVTKNLTAVIATGYEIFVTDTPSTSLSLTASVIPYLSNLGRVRSNLDASFRKEIIADFYWDLTFYGRYDSEPPSLGASNTDWGIVTSFGYSF